MDWIAALQFSLKNYSELRYNLYFFETNMVNVLLTKSSFFVAATIGFTWLDWFLIKNASKIGYFCENPAHTNWNVLSNIVVRVHGLVLLVQLSWRVAYT